MSCNKPLVGYQYSDGGALVFNKPFDRPTERIEVPCGQCMGCRKSDVADWVGRALNEGRMHEPEHNHFLTLTYDDLHLPEGLDLPYRDIQLFHHRLRKKVNNFRFVNVGEYGGKTGRPHWHEILFGIEIKDLESAGKGSQGDILYQSELITDLWGKGAVMIGEFNVTTAAYVSGYALKDTKAKHAGSYDYVDENTGELIERSLPRRRQSTNPGIGSAFYDKYTGDIWPKGYTTDGQGRKFPAPKYYLEKLKKTDPELHERIIEDRKALMRTPGYRKDNTPERRATKERCRELEVERVNSERKTKELKR